MAIAQGRRWCEHARAQSGWQSDCNHSAIIYDRRRPPASRVRDRRETAARPLRPRAPPPRPQHLSPRFSQVHAAVFAGSRRGFAEIRPRNRGQIRNPAVTTLAAAVTRSRPRPRLRDSVSRPRLTHGPRLIHVGRLPIRQSPFNRPHSQNELIDHTRDAAAHALSRGCVARARPSGKN